jgi:uncharacterized membrane protein YeaQ/YmgE (transglycosylase-associated protein family)
VPADAGADAGAQGDGVASRGFGAADRGSDAHGVRAPRRRLIFFAMHILWTLLIGFFIGLLARALHPGNDKMGLLATSLLGIGGSVVATYGGQALHFYRPGQTAGFLGATVGAIVLLVAGHAIRGMTR